MSKGTGSPEQPSDMTRARFLGLSAAAGTALGAFARPSSAAGAAAAVAPVNNDDAKRCADNLTEQKWAISSKRLNTIWNLVLPRILAATWQPQNTATFGIPGSAYAGPYGNPNPAPNTWPPGVPPKWPPSDPYDIGPDLVTWIDWFLAAQLGSARFLARIEDLKTYLGATEVPRMSVAGGGFDFLLHDQGIEFFVPTGPAEYKRLLFLYVTRRTGRHPIGIANVEATYLSDSPTGPSQLPTMDPISDELDVTFYGSGGEPLSCPADLRDDDSEPARQVYARYVSSELVPLARTLFTGHRSAQAGWRFEIDRLGTITSRELGLPNQVVQSDLEQLAGDLPQDGPIPEGDLSDFTDRFREIVLDRLDADDQTQVTPCEPVTWEDHVCETKERSCWAMEGSVYRGILEQLPRVVARVWHQDRQATLATTAVVGDLRARFESRLETSLPSEQVMAFTTTPPNPPFGTNVWDDDGVMVSNQGVWLPSPSAPGAAGTAQDTRTGLLVAIVQGNAGNPVFTDSTICI